MSQFHVFRLDDGTLFLDLQSDNVDTGSRVGTALVPLEHAPTAIDRFEAVFKVDGRDYLMRLDALAAVRQALLPRTPIADLTHEDYAIRRGLDLLFSGN